MSSLGLLAFDFYLWRCFWYLNTSLWRIIGLYCQWMQTRAEQQGAFISHKGGPAVPVDSQHETHRLNSSRSDCFFKKNYLFIFGGAGSLLLRGLLSRCSHQGLLTRCGAHCGCSLWWLLLLPSMALGVQASVVTAHGLSSCCAQA